MKPALYTADFKVRSYEVGVNQQATLYSIANYLQEIAGLHANELNFDISNLNDQGLTWVLFKMHIVIKSYPLRWSGVKVETWPSSGEGVLAYRDYRVYNDNQELICKAISQWMVLDTERGRPVRLPKELLRFPAVVQEPGLDYTRKNLQNPAADGVGKKFITRVGLHHLDMNNHVNNARYIEWLTGYNNSFADQPSEISLQYINEAKTGGEIYLSIYEEPDGKKVFNKLTNQNDDLIAIARVHY